MKVKKLIHKDCGGRIKIIALWGTVGGGTNGEGYCRKCKEKIMRRDQIDWKKSKINDNGNLGYSF